MLRCQHKWHVMNERFKYVEESSAYQYQLPVPVLAHMFIHLETRHRIAWSLLQSSLRHIVDFLCDAFYFTCHYDSTARFSTKVQITGRLESKYGRNGYK